jgi:hypothetical protein
MPSTGGCSSQEPRGRRYVNFPPEGPVAGGRSVQSPDGAAG